MSRITDEPIRSVVAYLRAQRSEAGFNFETVLASLEELDEFALRKQVPNAWQRVSGNLSAFAELREDFAKSAGDQFLTARWEVINAIHKFVTDRTANSSPTRLRSFFDRLQEEFDLTVVTLNYDDLIDQAGQWYDGFDGDGTFDLAGFNRKAIRHSAVLLHLHGSVRFGYRAHRYNPPGERRFDIVKHGRAEEALRSIPQRSGEIAGPAPIISGENKDKWMTRRCVPFGYYYNAFINCALDCPRLIVIGYGSNDLHVNSWLADDAHHRIHGFNKRMVLIDNDPKLRTQHVKRALIFGGNDGNFPPQDPAQVEEIIDSLRHP